MSNNTNTALGRPAGVQLPALEAAYRAARASAWAVWEAANAAGAAYAGNWTPAAPTALREEHAALTAASEAARRELEAAAARIGEAAGRRAWREGGDVATLKREAARLAALAPAAAGAAEAAVFRGFTAAGGAAGKTGSTWSIRTGDHRYEAGKIYTAADGCWRQWREVFLPTRGGGLRRYRL